PRRLALRPLPLRSELPEMSLPAIALFPDLPPELNHRQRSTRRIAAFVLLFRAGPHPGLRLVVHRNNAVTDRQLARYREIHQSGGGLMRNNMKGEGVPANDAPKRPHPFMGAPTSFSRVYGENNRARDSQRAGHGNTVEFTPSLFEDFACTRQ